MALVDDILQYSSVAIVGLAKNAGKTETLNYILRQAARRDCRLGITSIGIDGENVDQVSKTHKPEITLFPGMTFVTSEKHFRMRRLTAEITALSDESTSLGRLVTGRVELQGKVILSGPADTAGLRRLLARLEGSGVATTIVDGALSRLSLASPAVTRAMVLATGAALSPNIERIVRHTRFVYDLISLPAAEEPLRSALAGIESGVYAADADGQVHDLEVPSVLMLEKMKDRIFAHGTRLFVAGAVTDKLLQFLRTQKNVADIELTVKDFTRIFAEPTTVYTFLRKGGKINVLQRSRLLAVSINPTSPQGYRVDSRRLQEALEQAVDVPVYDVMRDPDNSEAGDNTATNLS